MWQMRRPDPLTKSDPRMVSTNATNLQSENAVLLNLLTIWISQPQVWFEQLPAQLDIRQISSNMTMYYYVVSALDLDTACGITNFLRHPPATDKYQSIMALLTKRFGARENER
ncbi:hypothetical protein T03_5831 [Trichinella britovi]|uniref:DUF7041 domain-containing protein n=2 Tax=Trichinella britovi TaxID=45882 RepID=A0A0V1C5D1_TRIBR|nr:hypothetical protein T03_5831 [Trichinella britovi]